MGMYGVIPGLRRDNTPVIGDRVGGRMGNRVGAGVAGCVLRVGEFFSMDALSEGAPSSTG